MQQRSNFPYGELSFDRRAAVLGHADVHELVAQARAGAVTDVIVISHGWNNDIKQAAQLYEDLAKELRASLDGNPNHQQLKARKFALLAIQWPSKRFAERSLIPGGAAAIGSAVRDKDLIDELETVKELFAAPDRIADAAALVPKLENSPAARDAFVEALRDALQDGAADDPDDSPGQFHSLTGRKLLDRLSAPVLPTVAAGRTGGAAGGVGMGRPQAGAVTGAAAGLSFNGIKAAALRALNLTTYYEMKARAGSVGFALNPVLRDLRAADVRLHLVGHSFGGRVVTAATMGGPGEPPLPVDSLTLLQAAFSHYGFAKDYEPKRDGFFRAVLARSMVTGPLVITHSRCDTAVGYAYPIASRLMKLDAATLGDADDRFGGIGRNGAQHTPEAENGTLLPGDGTYAFSPGAIHNLNADEVIGDHSDVSRPEVANAILSAIGKAP